MSIRPAFDDRVHWRPTLKWMSLEGMHTTHHNHDQHPFGRRETDSQANLFGNLITDVHRIGPAPTRGREAFAAGFSIILVGVVIGVMAPGLVFSSIAALVVLSIIAIRWAVGSRKWGQR